MPYDEAKQVLSAIMPTPLSDEQKAQIEEAFARGYAKPVAGVFPKPEAGPFRSQTSSPTFEIDLLPNPFQSFIRHTTATTGLAADYIAAGLLAAAAAAIGTTRRVTTVLGCGYEEPPILWLGAIGPPGAAKTPSLAFAKKGIAAIEAELAEGNVRGRRNHKERKLIADTRRSKWESEVEKAIKAGSLPPPMPSDADDVGDFVADRILLGDATPESVTKICAGLPRGVLLMRDELSGWWSSFIRYQGGGEREFYLECYEANSYISDRVKHGGAPLFVESLAVSIVGGVQPEKLRDFLDGPCDGLAERFLWFWPAPSPTKVPTQRIDVTKCVDALRRLRSLQFCLDQEGKESSIVLPLSYGALENFRQFKERKDQLVESLDERRAIRGALSKGDKVVLRLALVLQLMAWAGSPARDEPHSIDDNAMANAIHLWESYSRPVMFRVFEGGSDRATAAARDLASWIVNKRPGSFTQTQVREAGLKSLKGAKDAKAALCELVEANWIFPNFSRQGGTPGRSRQEYVTNPNVLAGAFLTYR